MKYIKIVLFLLFPILLNASGIWPLFFEDNNKITIFSPFFQKNKDMTILRPIFLYEKDNFYLFYPLINFSKDYKRIFPIYTCRKSEKNHTNLFPFFWGKTKDNRSYGGFFPIYGKLLNRLEYDKINFFLWPIWTEKEKNQNKDFLFLWPFLGWSKGKDYTGFRFWPFFGIKQKKNYFYKKFFIWPFFIFQKKRISHLKKDFEYKNIYFPFFIHTYSSDYDYKTIIYPFFRYNTHKSGYKSWSFPWPIFTYEKENSSGKYYKFTFFPIYRKIYMKNYQKESFLWIFFRNESTFLKGKKLTTKKSFLLINRYEKNYQDNTSYVNFWPLFEYVSSNDDYVFKFLELFPFKIKPIYKLYSTFFNIFYISKKGCKKKINFLWGLFTYESDKNYKIFKIFQIVKLKIKKNHEKKILSDNFMYISSF